MPTYQQTRASNPRQHAYDAPTVIIDPGPQQKMLYICAHPPTHPPTHNHMCTCTHIHQCVHAPTPTHLETRDLCQRTLQLCCLWRSGLQLGTCISQLGLYRLVLLKGHLAVPGGETCGAARCVSGHGQIERYGEASGHHTTHPKPHPAPPYQHPPPIRMLTSA